MSYNEPVSILIVNESAEEIKHTTLSFRGFFPNCRIEAVYSLEEAFQWAHRVSWHLILVDDRLHAQRAEPIIPELKRFAPYATLVLQTERADTPAALTALQDGADFLLYKKSPAFLTELMLYAKGLFETHAYRMTLERTQERHTRLTELLPDPDLLYELDSTGRFVCVSPHVADMLGYAQDELIGVPYFRIIHPDQRDDARHHFNDRRTGARATREKEFTLIGKPSADSSAPLLLRVRVSAKGLYDPERRHFGTLGLLHIVGEGTSAKMSVQPSNPLLQRADQLSSFISRVSSLSQRLHTSCTTIHGQSQLLLKTLRETPLTGQAESPPTSAPEITPLEDGLVRSTDLLEHAGTPINHIIDAVLSECRSVSPGIDQIERAYASNLPPFTGNADCLAHAVRILLLHAQRYIATMGGYRGLRISTTRRTSHERQSLAASTDPTSSGEYEIRIHEIRAATAIEWPPIQTAIDLFDAYVQIKQLGGYWEFLDSVGGRLSIAVWLPIQSPSESGKDCVPSPLSDRFIDVAAHPSYSEIVHDTTTAEGPATIRTSRPSHSLPDRRAEVRTPVNLPTRVTIGNAVRQGALTDLSYTGATIEVDGSCFPLKHESVHVIFKTAAGSYELHATVRHQRQWSKRRDSRLRTTRLAIVFSPLTTSQREVLGAYIDEARTRMGLIVVEVLLLPTATNEVHDGIDAAPATRGIDHRETIRVRVSLPMRLESPSCTNADEWPIGVVINLSRGGACIQTVRPIDTPDQIIALHFSAADCDHQPRTHEPEAPEAVLIGRIVHRDTDCTVSDELQSDPSQHRSRLGIRFIRLVPFSEREINRVIIQHLDASMDRTHHPDHPSIISTRRECRNARHQIITGTDDHARDQISPGTPILLIVPGFGRTQSDYLPLAYYLAANRFRVLRYDHTNHIGQSDGDIVQLTLRGMQADLQNVLAFIQATWPTAPISILAEDIAARVAIKVMAAKTATTRLLALNPVLDIEAALSTPSRPDAISGYRKHSRQGVANLWGLNVNVDQFIADAMAGGYADLASSAADVARLATPPVILTSPRAHRPAEYVFGPQHQSFRAMGSMPIVIPLHVEVSGESDTCDERHVSAFRTICKLISSPSPDKQPAPHMREPHEQEIRRQRRLEQERIRIRYHVSQATREALSVAYAAQLSQFWQLPDYRMLINELHQRLLPLDPGATVLDIGCGVGDFARVMLTNYVYRLSHQSGRPVVPMRYIGLDLSHDRLKLAQQQIQTLGHELLGTIKAVIPISQFIETHWVQADRAVPLPLVDGSIDRVLCQLVLPFTASPLACLRHALRVLHPDGTAIVTCFQPHTDLSTLFRQHYRATGIDESSQQAQIVLHCLGRVREAIRQGILHHYERTQLASLLSHAGAKVIQIYPALDNQLLLAIVSKGKSTG